MRHTLQVEGFELRLRPVEMADAGFIVWLRNLQHARGRIGDSARDIPAQEEWLRAYFDRPDDYYFIVESSGQVPIGTYGLYEFQEGTAEAGRWILRLGVPAAVGCVLLAIEMSFETLGLRALRARTVATNRGVLSLHRKIGFRQVGTEPKGEVIGGEPVDMVNSILTAEDAARGRQRFQPVARWAEPKIVEWEKAELRQAEATSPSHFLSLRKGASN